MDISESVQALLSSKLNIIRRFYDHMFMMFPELRRHFVNRDLHVQATMLTMALSSVEGYYRHRFPATAHYLKVLGNRHFHEGVRAEDYAKFQAALLETLKEFFADEWSKSLEREWSEALELAFEKMQQGYEGTHTM